VVNQSEALLVLNPSLFGSSSYDVLEHNHERYHDAALPAVVPTLNHVELWIKESFMMV
jgi:hypothetical protein